MFDSSMSGEQLLNEYNLDLQDLQTKTLRFDKSDYIARHLHKNKKESELKVSKVFTSSRGNLYIGVLHYRQVGSKKNRSWNMKSYHFGLMDSPKGLMCLSFYDNSRQVVRHTPHFFCRYKDRFSQICDWRTKNRLVLSKRLIDTIAIYVSRNLCMTWIETEVKFQDRTHIFGLTNDGVVLLQWDHNRKLLQANTFVTENMLSEKQSRMVGYARTYLSLSETERKKHPAPDFITGDY